MQKLIMKISLLVDHRKAQSLPFQTKIVSCKSGEYFLSYAQWRSQDIAVARAQHGHTTFVRTSARSAEAYRGV